VAGTEYECSDWEQTKNFRIIFNAGYSSPVGATPRWPLDDIMAACGQLKSEERRETEIVGVRERKVRARYGDE